MLPRNRSHPGSQPARLLILLHVPLPERLPVVLRTVRCAPATVKVLLMVPQPAQLAQCLDVCRRSWGGPCDTGALEPREFPPSGATDLGGRAALGCVAAAASITVNQKNVARHATGEHHLLFAHADMWFNLRAVLRASWFQAGHAALTPHAGLADRLRPADRRAAFGPVCVSQAQLRRCNTSTGHFKGAVKAYTCSGHRPGEPGDGRDELHRWYWWDRDGESESVHCNRLARQLGLRECCYGWVDLLFLPARAHAPFRRLARQMSAIFHEVAIPTILNQLRHEDGPAPSKVWWKPSLDCVGGCCQDVEWNSSEASGWMCAHKVALQRDPPLVC